MTKTHIQQIQEQLKNYPDLIYKEDESSIVGSIEVDEFDFYQIRIKFMDSFCSVKNARVYEISERIPVKLDRHVYLEAGELCFSTPTRLSILYAKQVRTVTDLIEKLIKPYLQNNSFFEQNGRYKFGEYSHRESESLKETYVDILGVDSLAIILRCMNDRVKIGRNNRCYCGSGEKLKKCGEHESDYADFMLIPKELIKKALKALEAICP